MTMLSLNRSMPQITVIHTKTSILTMIAMCHCVLQLILLGSEEEVEGVIIVYWDILRLSEKKQARS